jgi:hypothetical protein
MRIEKCSEPTQAYTEEENFYKTLQVMRNHDVTYVRRVRKHEQMNIQYTAMMNGKRKLERD